MITLVLYFNQLFVLCIINTHICSSVLNGLEQNRKSPHAYAEIKACEVVQIEQIFSRTIMTFLRQQIKPSEKSFL